MSEDSADVDGVEDETVEEDELADLRDGVVGAGRSGGLQPALAQACVALTEVVGVPVATISRVFSDGNCETVAMSGPSSVRRSLMGSTFGVDSYREAMLAAMDAPAGAWIPADKSCGIGVLHPAAELHWGRMRPIGLVVIPLEAASGRLVGILTVSAPKDGEFAEERTAHIVEIKQLCEQAFANAGVGAAPVERPSAADSDAGSALADEAGLLARLQENLGRMRTDGTTGAVLYCVLTEYEGIAAEHGVEAAEELVGVIAARILGTIRSYDLAGRVAADTLVIVADLIAPVHISSMTARLRRSMSKVHIINNSVVRVRGIIGSAPVSGATPAAETGYQQAYEDCLNNQVELNGAQVLYSRYGGTGRR